MATIHLQNNQANSESELTLGEVIHFIFKAKWFALIGIFFGTVAAFCYLAITPSVYESKVTLQIQPTVYPFGPSQLLISSEEIIERFKFSKTAQEISLLMNLTSNDETYKITIESLKSATISKAGTFLTLSIKAGSPTSAEELAHKIANASSVYITKINAPRIIYLERLFNSNQKLIATGNSKIDITALQSTNLAIESFLSSPEVFIPYIVDGPLFNSRKISPNTNSIFLLGALLGLGLWLLFFYFKENFSKK